MGDASRDPVFEAAFGIPGVVLAPVVYAWAKSELVRSLLDLKKQYATLKDEILRVTAEVYESQGFILGPRVEAFEKAVAAYVGAKHAIGMSSGTDAQLAVMMALGVGPGDDVVTSPYTFFATAGAVARLGARPVFVDIEPETFNLDPAQLEEALTPKTKAHPARPPLRPVRGHGPDPRGRDEEGDPRPRGRLPVPRRGVRRACKAGALGDSGAFSFFPSKNLGGFGDGGMVTTQRRRARRDAPRDAHARRDEPRTTTSSSAGTSASTRCRPRSST